MWYSKFIARSQFFFNKINPRVKRIKRDSLYQVSGLIKTACARSMRRRAGTSSPGKPPHVHTRGQGLRSIQFDVRKDHSIVGAVKFRWSNFYNLPQPHVHEFGTRVRSIFGFKKTYSERSFMYSTVRRLAATGKISRKFRTTIGRI